MIKRLFVITFLLCISARLSAQVYGNEWINYSQKHYRISISKTGLYRIDSMTLANSGIPLATIDPRNFQLFIKGQEQHIYVKGESDNVFNSSDYIEFFAEKNDCRFDSAAYYNILRLPNPYVALYNDTNYAYLTWNASISNKRMIPETDTAFTGYTPADYFWADRVTSFSSHYSTGDIASGLLEDPRNITGEGFGVSVGMQSGNVVSSNSSQLVYQSSTLPVYIQASYSGSSFDPPSGANYDHHIRVSYYDNTGNTVTLNDTTFYGYKQFLIERQITSNQLQGNSYVSVTNVNDPALSSIAGNQKNTTHYIRIRYPQKTDFGGASEQVFYLDDAAAPKSYLNIASVLTLTNTPIFYDLSNHKYITVITAAGGAKVLVPNSGSQKKCLLTNSSNVITVTALNAVNQTGYFVNYTVTHPDSAYLIVTHKNFLTSANAYKTYRQGINGGLNNVIMADVDDLYDQFAYGNKKNPLAIRNFCKFLVDSLPTAPKYLLLIGKSINNYEARNNWDSCFVPTMGRPSSDNLFTAGFKGTSSVVPYIATGRISAKTDATVSDYLDKIKSHEYGLTQTDTLGWRKRVLHFAGGVGSSQQSIFQSYLQFQAGIISDTLFGGRVFRFNKTTTAPIQITMSDSVKKMIDYGTSIINFFGHGYTTGFDQSIDDPKVYSNKDKYPLFIANSCYSGNIHTPSTSASENFTLIKEKGSIAFVASSSTGVESYLNLLTTELYRSLAYRKYYKGIGDAVKEACYYNSFSMYPLMEVSCQEMTLEGDPYMRLNAFALPDYEIHNSSISFNTASYPDSVGININIRNLGKAIRDSFIVRVERVFPTGNAITFVKQVNAPFNAGMLSFFIPKDFENGIGLNHFSVNIDYFNTISELSESNNATNGTVDLFIPGGDVIPVYPYKYAIIPNTNQITLKATTADPFSPAANYRIQLDTNDTFQSGFLKSTMVNSIGGVIEWTVNLTEGDSTVYFWRITKDSVTTTDRINWRESSFEVYRDKHGWGQSHFHQFKNDSYQFVKFKRPQRRFEFENDTKSLECNDRFVFTGADITEINYYVNGSQEDYYSCAPGGWSFAVFDSVSAKAMEQYIVPAGLGIYNNCICNPGTPFKVVVFGSSNFCGVPTPNWQDDMRLFLAGIPPNQKILAWSQQNHASQSYSPALRDEFKKFGASSIDVIKDTVPYIIYGTKRPGLVPGTAHEAIGTNQHSIIQLKDTLKTKWSNGYIASELIGPSIQWNSLHWNQMPQELPNKDSILIQVIGIRANGTRDTLARFTKDSTDVYDLANYVNATTYPFMQLVARMSDTINLTPPQLKKWQVYYDEAPECAINPKKGYTINKTTLQEGEALVVSLPIENIGMLPFNDSLVVTYWIEDKNRVLHYLPQKMKRNAFAPAQVIVDTIYFNSYDNLGANHIDYTGANYLWVDVNPPANSKYQREQYHFNNVARIAFDVLADKINPLLDVTFDGTHILNGDIVSAKPHVLVTLKDENKFLALNDTNNFKLFIRYPNQPIDKPLYFSNNALQFTPAQLPGNSCKIEWRPELAEDGTYRLIVQAADRTRNVSGATDYNIQFEVINKETVTEVLNYPNPFSTSTKFVFTLTGSETPDVFIIQIMTITGKVVKEITKNELGNLHIGRNITSYAWDGRDDFGDKLANGVYLYRVITRHNGQAIEKRETEADSFFKKGIGKLVIMR